MGSMIGGAMILMIIVMGLLFSYVTIVSSLLYS